MPKFASRRSDDWPPPFVPQVLVTGLTPLNDERELLYQIRRVDYDISAPRHAAINLYRRASGRDHELRLFSIDLRTRSRERISPRLKHGAELLNQLSDRASLQDRRRAA